MGIDDAYSLYVTIKGDTSQGNTADPFARTILAISDSEGAYLLWLGIYKNYLHLYSFHKGASYGNVVSETNKTDFTSLYIGEYNEKIFNIQISAVRSELTKIYINGNLIKEFNSGGTKISYSKVVLGDLRIGRNLRFVGKIYDLAIYNKEITAEEVTANWEYARDTWNITEANTE